MDKDNKNGGCVGCLSSLISYIIILAFGLLCIKISIKFFPELVTAIIIVFFIFCIVSIIISDIQGNNASSNRNNKENNPNTKYMTSEEWENEIKKIEKDISSIRKDISFANDELDNLQNYHVNVTIKNKNSNSYNFSKRSDLEKFARECNEYLRKQDIKESEKNYKIDFDNMEGHDFEYFCAELLKKNGFSNVEVTQGSGDQGIDILAVKDGIKYGIQCKCYSSDIGNKAVQEAFSGKSFYNCHVGVVLTNRFFTSSAKELAEKNGILLWDRNMLSEFIENIN